MRYAFFLLLAAFTLGACNLEKDIDIELPAYESQIVLECYLEPGKPFRLSLSRGSGFFDSLPSRDPLGFLGKILVQEARVTIRHAGTTYVLDNRLIFDGKEQRLYNYQADALVPLDTLQPFTLEILTKDGKTITASTKLLPVVPIDSIVINFKEGDTLARALTYFTDPPGQPNYFRRVLHLNTLDSIPEQDFTVDDRFVENVFVFGSGYDYQVGDTLINTIYHIDQAYFNFLESLQRAVFANINPFAQPSSILSNLGGTANAIGVFTGLQYSRVETVIRR